MVLKMCFAARNKTKRCQIALQLLYGRETGAQTKQKRAGHWPARLDDLLQLLEKELIFSFSWLFSSWLSSLPRRHLLLGENGDPGHLHPPFGRKFDKQDLQAPLSCCFTLRRPALASLSGFQINHILEKKICQ
jgi:hypothetical protein